MWSITWSPGIVPIWHLEGKYDWIEGDLADFEVCRRAVEGVACVFHQAAIPSVPRSVKEPLLSHLTGPTATLNLLEASRLAGVRRFLSQRREAPTARQPIFPSTRRSCRNRSRPTPRASWLARPTSRLRPHDGSRRVSLRYFNIFGPRQDPSSPYSGVISVFAKHMAAGQAPVIYGDGGQTRDFTYVANVVSANLLAMLHPEPLEGAVYNVGTGRRISLLALVKAINKVLGTNSNPSFARSGPATSAIHRRVSSGFSKSSPTGRSSTLNRGFGCHSNPCDQVRRPRGDVRREWSLPGPSLDPADSAVLIEAKREGAAVRGLGGEVGAFFGDVQSFRP